MHPCVSMSTLLIVTQNYREGKCNFPKSYQLKIRKYKRCKKEKSRACGDKLRVKLEEKKGKTQRPHFLAYQTSNSQEKGPTCNPWKNKLLKTNHYKNQNVHGFLQILPQPFKYTQIK